jgi:hypothetical protein
MKKNKEGLLLLRREMSSDPKFERVICHGHKLRVTWDLTSKEFKAYLADGFMQRIIPVTTVYDAMVMLGLPCKCHAAEYAAAKAFCEGCLTPRKHGSRTKAAPRESDDTEATE